MSSLHPLSGHHYIAGEWTASEGESVCAVNAATGEQIQPAFHQAGLEEVNSALDAAVKAFEETRDLPPMKWAELLETIAESIMTFEAELIERANQETALPVARLKSEIGRTTGQLKLFAQYVREGSWVDAIIDRADPARQPLPKPDVRRMLRPLGPIVIFDASNFPFAFGACGGDTASALAAGNPVIVKAHPGHPGTNEIFAAAVHSALEKTGLPAGMFSNLQGAGTEIGKLLVLHPDVEAVGFTGSLQGGRALFDLASERPSPIPVYAEMGSLNPLVLLPAALDERADEIAAGLANSITLGGGQFCTKPGLILFIGSESGKKMTSLLTEKLAALPSATLLYAGIRERFGVTLDEFQAIDSVETHLESTKSGNAGCSPALLEVDSDTWKDNPTLSEEAFGPAALLVRCEDREDLLATLDLLDGQLTGTLHTGKSETIDLVKETAGILERKVGRLIYNGYPTGVEVCHAMVHGGPYPATSNSATTSVGTSAIRRFVRPISFQNAPDSLLPSALQNANPLGIMRHIDGKHSTEQI